MTMTMTMTMGLGLGYPASNAIFLAALVAVVAAILGLILLLPQRAGQHEGAQA